MTEGIGFARVGWWRSRSSVKDEDKALMNVALDFRAVPVGISRSGTIVTPQIVSRGDVSHRAGVRRKRERERERRADIGKVKVKTVGTLNAPRKHGWQVTALNSRTIIFDTIRR